MVEQVPACPNCNGARVAKTIDYLDWWICKCGTCGFRFATGGAPVVLASHYDDDYFQPMIERDRMSKWQCIYKERLAIARELAPNVQLLELGTGAGSFAIQAQNEGFEVSVIDGSPTSIARLEQMAGIPGKVEDLNELHLCEDSFGTIHCAHVLEHLSNPLQFLEASFHGLCPGGILLLSFPAYEGPLLAFKDGLYKLGIANFPYNYQAPDHVSFYSLRCICETLQRIGFALVSVQRTKLISIHSTFDSMAQVGPVRRLLKALSNGVEPLTGRVGYHRDLEIVARKPPVEGGQ